MRARTQPCEWVGAVSYASAPPEAQLQQHSVWQGAAQVPSSCNCDCRIKIKETAMVHPMTIGELVDLSTSSWRENDTSERTEW